MGIVRFCLYFDQQYIEGGAPGGSSLVGLLMLDWYENVDNLQRHLYRLQALDGCLYEYLHNRSTFHFQSELLLEGVVGSLFTDEEQKHGWLMTL